MIDTVINHPACSLVHVVIYSIVAPACYCLLSVGRLFSKMLLILDGTIVFLGQMLHLLLDCKIYNLLSIDLGKEVSYMYYTISYSRISSSDALTAFIPHLYFVLLRWGFSVIFLDKNIL